MAKIEIDTDNTVFFERRFLSYDKINNDCKLILRSLIALYKYHKSNPIVSLSYFGNLYGISKRKIEHSMRVLENRRFMRCIYKRNGKMGEIYEFELNKEKIKEEFPFFSFALNTGTL